MLCRRAGGGGGGDGGGGGGGTVLPYVYYYIFAWDVNQPKTGWGGSEVNSQQLMALFQVMYDPHQSTTVVKPVRKGVKKKKIFFLNKIKEEESTVRLSRRSMGEGCVGEIALCRTGRRKNGAACLHWARDDGVDINFKINNP